MPLPINFIGNENSPTINGDISWISPTILGMKVTMTVNELLVSILTLLCEKVKLRAFLNKTLTGLEEKFSILSSAYFLELSA